MNTILSDAITTVIPVYNRSNLLKRAIESVLKQTLPPKEILVIDDGSTEDLTWVIKSFCDDRIQHIRQENLGPASARNHGIRLAKGNLIAFLDSDDEWRQDFLEKSTTLLNQFPSAGFCFSDGEWFKNDALINPSMNWGGIKHSFGFTLGIEKNYSGLIKKNQFRQAQIRMSLVLMSAVIIRKNLFDTVGYFNPEYRLSEDFEFWIRASRSSDACYLDLPLCRIHTVDDNITSQPDVKPVFRKKLRQILQNELDFEQDSLTIKLIKSCIRRSWEDEITDALEKGDWVYLQEVLYHAKSAGWKPNEGTIKRIKLSASFGPSAGLVSQFILNILDFLKQVKPKSFLNRLSFR